MARHRSNLKVSQENQQLSSSHLTPDPAAKVKKIRKKSPDMSFFLVFPLMFKIIIFLGIFGYGLVHLVSGNQLLTVTILIFP